MSEKNCLLKQKASVVSVPFKYKSLLFFPTCFEEQVPVDQIFKLYCLALLLIQDCSGCRLDFCFDQLIVSLLHESS